MHRRFRALPVGVHWLDSRANFLKQYLAANVDAGIVDLIAIEECEVMLGERCPQGVIGQRSTSVIPDGELCR